MARDTTREDIDVALCISGQMRTYKKCFGNLKENVLESLDPDVYIYTDRRTGVTNRSDGVVDVSEADEIVTMETLKALYDPVRAEIIDPPEDMHREFKSVRVPEALMEAEPDRWKGNIPLFHGIYQCNEMKREYEKENGFTYDIVIRMRPDLLLREGLPDEVLETPDTLWHGSPRNFVVDDRFAVSSSENMDHYASVWERLSEYWQDPVGDGDPTRNRVGGRLMNIHMEQSDIPTRMMDIDYTVLRSRGFFEQEIRADMKLFNHVTYDNLKRGMRRPQKALKFLYSKL